MMEGLRNKVLSVSLEFLYLTVKPLLSYKLVMDLNLHNVAQTVFPTAAFRDPDQSGRADDSSCSNRSIPWTRSSLNPKNRIDSLDCVQPCRWRVDGCAGMGTQFYTLPIFLSQLLPIRVDTFIPEICDISVFMRDALDLGAAFYLRDSRVADLAIARYIVRILDQWSSLYEDFETFYNGLPFGSRIVLENISPNIKDVKVIVVKTHFLERQLLSPDSLKTMWKLSYSTYWPEIIDISEVHLLRQLHDSVSLVLVRGQKFILKALTSYPKYLYHELKTLLLTLPTHPHIISRPTYLITKRSNFGGKPAVIGFTLYYHAQGTLRDILPFRRLHGTLTLQDQLRWALQLTSALVHIRDAGSFYCDLRLDNVVLGKEKSENNDDDIVMIDFESRGGTYSASAPEINFLEYIHAIATSEDKLLPPHQRAKFRRLYEKMTSGGSGGGGRRQHLQGDDLDLDLDLDLPFPSPLTERYRNPKRGYAIPWLCLTADEREAAQVYMLGRVLWCIFEGAAAPEQSVFVKHPLEDEEAGPDSADEGAGAEALEFPRWRSAPEGVRRLVERCCVPSGLGLEHGPLPVVRRGRLLVVRRGEEMGSEPGEVRRVAREWWEVELGRAAAFVEARFGCVGKEVGALPLGRPGLGDVLLELETLKRDLGV